MRGFMICQKERVVRAENRPRLAQLPVQNLSSDKLLFRTVLLTARLFLSDIAFLSCILHLVV
jgi:hypothetical protein